jgi:putative transposase
MMKYLVVHPELYRASRGWRGLTMTPKALRLLQDLRRQLVHPPSRRR